MKSLALVLLSASLPGAIFAGLSKDEEALYRSLKEILEAQPIFDSDWLGWPELKVRFEAEVHALDRGRSTSEATLFIDLENPLQVPALEGLSLGRVSRPGGMAALHIEEAQISVIVMSPFLPPIDFNSMIPEELKDHPAARPVNDLARLVEENEFAFIHRMISVKPSDLEAATDLSTRIEALLLLQLKPIVLWDSSDELRLYKGSDRTIVLSHPQEFDSGDEKSISGWALIRLDEYPRVFAILVRQRGSVCKEEVLSRLLLLAAETNSPSEPEREQIDDGNSVKPPGDERTP